MSLRVADFFCGAGGLSAGLEMAGFKTVFGIDSNADAIETFRANHPNATAFCGDATKFDLAALPDFDVLVGGPPCVNFSTSKGSRANVLDGLKLVQLFLRIVHLKKPLFWIMENVPRVALHLPEQIPLTWIGLTENGYLDVTQRREFNCADFGAPQTRKRYLIGNYPLPIQTHCSSIGGDLFADTNLKPYRTMREALKSLPSRISGDNRTTADPTYGIKVQSCSLDHYHGVGLTEEEAERIRSAKLEHPYMGRMSFPDDMDRPARTVVATQLGRETLVLYDEAKPSKSGFRRATVAECAVLQTFPLCFRFFGNSYSARYRQVGNAVPPILAFSIGKSILAHLGLPSASPKPYEFAPLPPTAAVSATSKLRRSTNNSFPQNKRFRRLIPGKEVRGSRVQLENDFQGSDALWLCRLYIGEGRANSNSTILNLRITSECLKRLTERHPEANEDLKKIESQYLQFIDEAELPDNAEWQKIYTSRVVHPRSPSAMCNWISDSIDKSFPAKLYSSKKLYVQDLVPITKLSGIRVRLLLAAHFCNLLINESKR